MPTQPIHPKNTSRDLLSILLVALLIISQSRIERRETAKEQAVKKYQKAKPIILQKPGVCTKCGKGGLGKGINFSGKIICLKGPCKKRKKGRRR